jgi:hypothetical protein
MFTVNQIQLFSAAAFPSMGAVRPRGDLMVATAFLDNITSAPKPSAALLMASQDYLSFRRVRFENV